MSGWRSDLVVLVADRSMEAAVRGLLSRPEALGIRRVGHEVYVHPYRDPGCFQGGHDFLRPFVGRCGHGLLMFDRQGCGAEGQTREALEQAVTRALSSAGWGDRAAALVLDPELEAWVWSDSPHVSRCLGWEGREPDLRTWLRKEALWPEADLKPADPKAAVEAALRAVCKPRSSAIYDELARNVSFQRCSDPAFLKLRAVLTAWFPAQTASPPEST